MANLNIQEEAIKAIILMNAAIRNIRLYPNLSGTTVAAINKAYEAINSVMNKNNGEISFAEYQRALLISNEALGEKEQKRPQITSFVEILLNFSIKSIELKRGLTIEEFRIFLEILSQKSEDIVKLGGIKNIVSSKRLSHIIVDQKIYVAYDKDDKNINFSNLDLDKYKSSKKKGPIEEGFSLMIDVLDEILEENSKQDVAYQIASSVVFKEEDLILSLFNQEIKGEFGDYFIKHLIDELDYERFERIFYKIKSTIEDKNGGSEYLRQIYQNMLASSKGEELRNKIKEKKEEEAKQKEYIKTGLNSILKGKKTLLEDRILMQAIPNAINFLISQKKDKSVELIIEKLGEGIISRSLTAKEFLLEAILEICEILFNKKLFDFLWL